MTVPLPLLSLLSIHQLSILNYFDFLDVISISLTSKRARKLIRCQYSQYAYIYLVFGITVELRLSMNPGQQSYSFYFTEADGALITNLEHPIEVGCASESRRLRRPGYRVMDWLTHFMETFQNYGIREIKIYRNQYPFDLESIRRNIQNYQVLYIDERCRNDCALEILECFSKSSNNRLVLRKNPFETQEDIQKYWAQSQEYHVVSERLARNYSLDDLLITNSSFVTINASIGMKLTLKCINRFFKLWIKGACPRLKYLNFYRGVFGFVRVEDVLKGIKYTETPNDRIREYEGPDGELRDLKGGFDIRRNDGTLATVTSETDYETLQECVKLIVWNF